MAGIRNKREEGRLDRFTANSTSTPYKEKPYFYTGPDGRTENSFYDNKIKPYTDLSLIIAPILFSRIGYEMGGLFGTATGISVGLIYDMLYLAKLDDLLRKAFSRFDPPY